jgi:Zn-dependent M28 family amino/carboxypeptidase
MKHRRHHLKLIVPVLILAFSVACSSNKESPNIEEFNGERAYQDIEYQVDLGPRVPGSAAHKRLGQWVTSELEDNGWVVTLQEDKIFDHEIVNIIANRSVNSDLPWIIIGAHYDTRMVADQEDLVSNRDIAIPGANDGASGISVLLELARVLPQDLDLNISLVFFDAEDQGNLPTWDWSLGAASFVESLNDHPDAVVIVDMVGDSDLNIFIEKNSNQDLVSEIWEIAGELGYERQFNNQPKHNLVDDHRPFVQANIPAVLIIDFDYPYWHTLADTADKVSPESLQVIGDVLLSWLYSLKE